MVVLQMRSETHYRSFGNAATIICIMVYGSEGSLTGCFTGGTDNQSNTFATRKLLSTKFPLTILIMELSEQL